MLHWKIKVAALATVAGTIAAMGGVLGFLDGGCGTFW
jgi:hypothetical protein